MSESTDNTQDKNEKVEKPEIHYVGFKRRMYAVAIDCIFSFFLIMVFSSSVISTNKIPYEIQNAIFKLEHKDISSNEFFQISLDYMIHNGGFIQILLNSTINYTIAAIFIIGFWIYRSATPGKMLLSIKIVDAETNKKPSAKQFILRYLSYIPSMLLFGIGFIMLAFNDKKQCLHDSIAKTAVIHTKPLAHDWKEKRFKRQSIMVIIFIILFLILSNI